MRPARVVLFVASGLVVAAAIVTCTPFSASGSDETLRDSARDGEDEGLATSNDAAVVDERDAWPSGPAALLAFSANGTSCSPWVGIGTTLVPSNRPDGGMACRVCATAGDEDPIWYEDKTLDAWGHFTLSALVKTENSLGINVALELYALNGDGAVDLKTVLVNPPVWQTVTVAAEYRGPLAPYSVKVRLFQSADPSTTTCFLLDDVVLVRE